MGRNTGKGGAESAVEERRLRPIYELLDIGLNKKAVQELDRLLKKQPNFSSAKVLKALALLRLGKRSECEGIIATIVSDDLPAPTDENTIQALSICYRELDKPRYICELLERACKLDKSEDLLTHSFMAHVRIEEYQKQHQIALSLYKLYPKTPYFSWSVMSLYAKSESELEDPSSHRLTLPLAARMMEKFIEENKIDSEHELHLYLLILLKQEKYDKILDIIASPSERTLGSVTGFLQKTKIFCLKQTKKNDLLVQYLENLLAECPDEWRYYEEYVKLCVEMDSEGGVQRMKTFLETTINAPSPTTTVEIEKQRPALLACFFACQLIVKNNITIDWDFQPLFELYCRHFGHKATFLSDVSEHLTALQLKMPNDTILSTLKSSFDTASPSAPRNHVQRELNFVFLEQSMQDEVNSTQFDCNKATERFESLVLKYLGSLSEKESFDDYLILATIELVDSFWSFKEQSPWTGFFKSRNHLGDETKRESDHFLKNDGIIETGEGDGNVLKGLKTGLPSEGKPDSDPVREILNGLESMSVNELGTVSEEDFPILYCASVLNFGLYESMNNAKMRILLGKLFIRCGAVGAAAETLRGLDLKHIQLESLGYLSIYKLMQCGFVNEAHRIFHHVEHFFSTYEKESTEHILSAYKYGSWEKILEFTQFRKLLLKSLQIASIRIERRLLDYLKDSVNRAESIKIATKVSNELKCIIREDWEDFSDCRDLSVLNETGVKKRNCMKAWEEQTFASDKRKLKIRSLTLAILNNCVLIMDNSRTEEEIQRIISIVDQAGMLLQEEVEKLDQSQEEADVNSITGPWSPRLNQYLKSGYCDLLLKFSSLISSLTKEPGIWEATLSKSSPVIKDKIEAIVKERIQAWKKFQTRKHVLEFSEVLESGFDVTETLGLVCSLLDVLGFVIQRNASPSQKSKKKKGKASTAEAYDFSHFTSLLTTTSECLTEVENELRCSTNALVQNFSTKWENLDGFWKENANSQIHSRIITYSMPTILYKLSESYFNSIHELTAINVSKIKYLGNIRAQF